MNSDEYQKLKEVFQSVLDLTADERLAYLDAHCADEPKVRLEVERLIASYDSTYLEHPVLCNFSNDDPGNGLRLGERIGHYVILEKIGSGGMGEVYLAEDGKLGRRVAIKLIGEIFTGDVERVNRFQLEARAVSALNHPNILTIFEIGETETTHYIATEYIDGMTLRSKLNRGKLSVNEALDIAVQCASALAAAHENGIIHRDIKPENIMLRRDNLVKLLDFGLAKLVEPREATINPDALTEKHVKTAPGVIMGTVQYMSPEQTRGHATDARTDIWSLGCVIYEMLAGSSPFRGDTTADMIAEIVKSYPEPLSRTVTDVPERLEEIIAKTLEKDPDERYQTAKDLLIDLKRLKRKFEVESELERSNPRVDEPGEFNSNGGTPVITYPEKKVSSVEYMVVGMKLHKRTAIALAAGLVALVGGTAYVARTYWRDSNDARFVYGSKIRLAAQALEVSNLSRARQLLDEIKPETGEEDRRGFEWGYLANALAEASASQLLALPQEAAVDAVAFSPDGKTLATGDFDNIARIWDLDTGEEVRWFKGHTALITFVSFSANGSRLLTTGVDETARVWDVATSDELFTLPAKVAVARFSIDGSAVIGASGKQIIYFDAATGVETGRFTSAVDIGALLLSPDGRFLAIRGHDQSIYILSATDKKSISTITGHSDWIMDFQFSTDSNFLVTASKDRTAKLWDVRSGKEIRTFKGHSDEIYEVEYSPDGTTIATGSHDRTIKLWDVARGFEITTLPAHAGNVLALAYSSDGRKLASGGNDDVVRVWNVPRLGARGVLRGHSKSVTRLAFSPSGKMLVSSSRDKTAKVWDVESEVERFSLGGHTDTVNSAIFSADGNQIVTISDDKKIRLWDSKTGRPLSVINSPVPATNVAISYQGKLIVTGHMSHDPMIRSWDVISGKLLCEKKAHKDGPWSIGFISGDRVVTAAYNEHTISIWNGRTCDEISSFKGDEASKNYLSFGRNNTWRALKILNTGRSLKWFEPGTDREYATFSATGEAFSDAKFSHDEKRLVTTDQGGRVSIWDSATGIELLSFTAIAGVDNLAVSPDGRTIGVGGNDGTIRLFRSSFTE